MQFSFRKDIKNKVAHFLREEKKKYMNSSGERYQNGSTVVNLKWSAQKSDLTWVGIHVRRGDFLYLRQISSVHFITEAMNYFEKKYDNVIFLIASDDKTF